MPRSLNGGCCMRKNASIMAGELSERVEEWEDAWRRIGPGMPRQNLAKGCNACAPIFSPRFTEFRSLGPDCFSTGPAVEAAGTNRLRGKAVVCMALDANGASGPSSFETLLPVAACRSRDVKGDKNRRKSHFVSGARNKRP